MEIAGAAPAIRWLAALQYDEVYCAGTAHLAPPATGRPL
jgi:hypothetical protein